MLHDDGRLLVFKPLSSPLHHSLDHGIGDTENISFGSLDQVRDGFQVFKGRGESYILAEFEGEIVLNSRAT
jgi:hypothetical protein